MFGIKLIILRSEPYIASFCICIDATFFSLSRFNNFLLIDATDRNKISSDQKRLFFAVSLYPFHFTRTLPLTERIYLVVSKSKLGKYLNKNFQKTFNIKNIYNYQDICLVSVRIISLEEDDLFGAHVYVFYVCNQCGLF